MAMTATVERGRERVGESEHTAPLWDGTEVFYRAWEPVGGVEVVGVPAKAILLLHRGHEHSGRLGEMVRALGLEGVRVFAWDQRGHGRSPGDRGYAPSFGSLVKDLDCFARWVCEHHGVELENAVVLGHSVGAVLVAAWLHDYAPPVRAAVLVTPALRIRLYVPLAIPGLRLLDRFKRPAFIKSYVKSRMLTHDAKAAAEYDADALISRNISVNILLGLHDASTRLLADARAVRTPTLVIGAGKDCVVRLDTQRAFFERLGSPIKQMEVHPGMRHAVLHETGRAEVFGRIRKFIAEAFEREAKSGAGAIPAPHDGAPHLPGLVRRAGYVAAGAFLRSVGRLSEGIRLGWSSGFDSGRSLDHVYRNTPAGTTPLGRLIDRVYLSGPGWAGIRQRKRNLELLLERAIRETHAAGRPVNILDVAAGPGRYVMETMLRVRGVPMGAVLRDRDEAGLAAGRELARRLGLANVAHEAGDAFDPASLTSVRPRPTIAIVSGLYELFPGNDALLRSLSGLHAALEDGGLLIYTNQPWHPQLAFIANVLTNREGKAWVMRCRSQAEMDGLARAAGFEKVAMETDENGIFTVSLARKLPGGASDSIRSSASL